MAKIEEIKRLSDKLVTVYVAMDDAGPDPQRVVYAAFNKERLIELAEHDRSFSYRSVGTIQIDVGTARKQALARLNGIERLVLDLPSWVDEGQSDWPSGSKK